MRVLYIAKHRQNNADDEGSIEYALQRLGHEVLCVQERGLDFPMLRSFEKHNPDLVLFHHWQECRLLNSALHGVKKVSWCFDLIEWPSDPTLDKRSAQRIVWSTNACDVADYKFFTDGDWVAKLQAVGVPGVHWLPQGADERISSLYRMTKRHDVLLTGTSRGGKDREEFVHDLKQRHGNVWPVEKGVYREQLRDLTARSRIVVCPDSPVTDRYWSNRVWNACGFGAFVLHPRCAELEKMYADGVEIAYYNNREHMHQLIRWWLEGGDRDRMTIGAAALERTLREHTYRHRVEKLLEVVNAGV